MKLKNKAIWKELNMYSVNGRIHDFKEIFEQKMTGSQNFHFITTQRLFRQLGSKNRLEPNSVRAE
jgi:hypothetical protein